MEFIGSGTVNTGGCSEYEVIYYYDYKFTINSYAWLKYKAKKGILEKVAIKSVKMISPYVFLYTDTFNSLHDEDDLLTHEEAIEMAKTYWENLEYISAKNIRNC